MQPIFLLIKSLFVVNDFEHATFPNRIVTLIYFDGFYSIHHYSIKNNTFT